MTRRLFVAAGAPAALLALSSPVAAQVPVAQLAGGFAGEDFGAALAFVGDLNADGVDDFAVGAPQNYPNGGLVRVFSGADFQLLYQVLNPEGFGSGGFGSAVAAAGDVDADGVPDLLIAGPQTHLLSGVDGSTIRVFEAAFAVAGLGDVDGDGTPDVALSGSPGVGLRSVSVHSGRTGATIWSRTASAQGTNWLGTSLAALGDLDGDGASELAVGSQPGPAFATLSGAQVLSGATGRVLFREVARPLRVAAAGDIDQDGVPDWIATDSAEGRARLRSGADGSLIAELTPYSRMIGAGDVTGDGVPDLWGRVGGNTLRLIDGATLDVLSQFGVGVSGAVLAGGADVTGDGRPDLLDGRPAEGGFGGTVRLWSLGCSATPVTSYCTAAPNSAGAGALMGLSGSTSLSAQDLVLETRGCPPNQVGLYLYGADAASAPFGDGFRCIDAPVRLGAPVSTGGGTASLALDFGSLPQAAPPPLLAGALRRFQLWYRDPGFGGAGFNLSDGLAVELCP